MMQAAMRGLECGSKNGKRPLLIAVTQLTSTSQEQLETEQQVNQPIIDNVCHYAKLVKEAGLDGVVCSPLEVEAIKKECGDNFITVTPGIRLREQIGTDDQVRVTTPSEAKALGSDYIVVGRPITLANQPLSSYHYIKSEWEANR